MKEYKIGEVFRYKKVFLKVCKYNIYCNDCYFVNGFNCDTIKYKCSPKFRKDKQNVYYKKVTFIQYLIYKIKLWMKKNLN